MYRGGSSVPARHSGESRRGPVHSADVQRNPEARAATGPRRALLVFLDGVGVGEPDPLINPVAAAKLPALTELLGGWIPVRAGDVNGRFSGNDEALWGTADALLGVPGLPRSGTGQTALLTGANAPRILGRHFGPWVPTTLRALLASDNILTRARRLGLDAAFANATPPFQLPDADGRWRRPAGPPFAAHAAGLPLAGEAELRDRRAVASSITNDRWRKHIGPEVPDTSPAEAGQTLGRISNDHHLTLFAHYDTDLIGHRGDHAAAVAVLEMVDHFIGSTLRSITSDTLLVITSDHGNIEDSRGGHTTNPVPVIAAGPGAADLVAGVTATTDIAPLLLSLIRPILAPL
jgi:hypothetical protein